MNLVYLENQSSKNSVYICVWSAKTIRKMVFRTLKTINRWSYSSP